MSSIIRLRDTYHGIIVFGRGVFTHDKHGKTYAGQHRGGYACGLGALTWPERYKTYAEHGPDGQYDGRCLYRFTSGHTGYRLYERGGKVKDSAVVFANGRCSYNHEACAPDDPRLLALIAQVAPVEVRRAARATQLPSLQNSPPSDRPMDRPARCAPAGAGGRRGHRGAAPHAVAGGCATQPNSIHTAKHVHTAARTRAFSRYWSHGRQPLAPTDNRRLVHTKGPSRQLRCHAIVQHAAC
jgi:hypothetical protein